MNIKFDSALLKRLLADTEGGSVEPVYSALGVDQTRNEDTSREDAVTTGLRWWKAHEGRIRAIVCRSTAVRYMADATPRGLAREIAKAVAGSFTPVQSTCIAVLIMRTGITDWCDPIWKVEPLMPISWPPALI